MKKLILAAVVGGLAIAGATGASASKLNISLDGYCNTFSLHIDSFAIYGSRSGCGYTKVDGGTVATVGSQYYITNDQNDKSSVLTWYFTPPSGGVGNWYLYSETKKAYTEVNSGTYTLTAGAQPPKAGRDASGFVNKAARALPTR